MIATSLHAVLCPECRVHKVDFVFGTNGARCVACNDAPMLDLVRAWSNGEHIDSLAEGLARYIGEPV
jgi:hypothetical protein